MKTLIKTRKVVQFGNRNYVQSFGYHKGYFNCTDTLDITLAKDFTCQEHLFDMNLRGGLAKLINVRITIEIDTPDEGK